MIHITPYVILFHRRLGYGKGEIVVIRAETAPQRKVGQGKGRHGNKTGQRHRRTGQRRQNGNRNCNMQSWERAKPLSRPDAFLETGGGCPVGM